MDGGCGTNLDDLLLISAAKRKIEKESNQTKCILKRYCQQSKILSVEWTMST